MIIQEKNGQTMILKINRPTVLNALNKDLIDNLATLLETLEDDEQIRSIILTGEGKAFVAGADIKEFQGISAEEAESLSSSNQEKLFNLIELYSKPIIAAINGYALGGGLELALAAHIRIAADTAKMGLPELSLGIIPGYGGTQRLAQIVGKGHALFYILTSDMITAARAFQIGLVSEVVPASNLLEQALAIAKKIEKNSPNAIDNAIIAIDSAYNFDGFEMESINFGNCFNHSDASEGIQAFLEKRKPNFSSQ